MDEESEIPAREVVHYPLKLFDLAKSAGRVLYVQAPMVRYSKLPFRALVRDYGVDLCYTPMVSLKRLYWIASAKKLLLDFTTNASDRPLIAQFGAHSSIDFSRAAELVKPYTDGVDLNCGCPQSWAIQEGIGCRLMQQPQLVKEMVRAAKDRCGEDFCVSIKIRVHHDLRETVDFVKMVESSGVDYITIHGRRRSQRSSEPVNSEAIALVKSLAGVPIVANGDVFSLGDAERIVGITGVDGVMAARGLMENPALFAGFKKTPWGAVERFLHYNANYGPLPYQLALHNVGEMLRDMMTKKERAEMTRNSGSIVEILNWLKQRGIGRIYARSRVWKGSKNGENIIATRILKTSLSSRACDGFWVNPSPRSYVRNTTTGTRVLNYKYEKKRKSLLALFFGHHHRSDLSKRELTTSITNTLYQTWNSLISTPNGATIARNLRKKGANDVLPTPLKEGMPLALCF
ncbi:unnamed protein product [Tuber melanosporum]|uniref:tRNA-dihydrouridine(20a/20b) synthase [NAD(P)+] n=1 Tax=Tuber melanosporum (strain Mel28) TaxID=656061 RepID=D5G5S3_TUBMM|nr:uncharacterized protein GSTUM_00001458001 [Tuber melanosporum]CAZ79866.1 unnamed protein product [Tuber melanosporum]